MFQTSYSSLLSSSLQRPF